MRRDKTEKLDSSQKTVWYYPEVAGVIDPRLQERHRYFELLQSHMLIEDVYTQIIPIVGLSKKESFKIHLLPPSGTVESLVASALKSRNHGWRQKAKEAGFEWHGWHAFRRGLATNLYQLGVPDKTIQAILRHSNLLTTMNSYVKSVPADAIAAMRSLEEICTQYAPQLA